VADPHLAMADPDDERWMARAVALASGRTGATGGNPTVGCVLVKDGRVVAEAATAPGGRPHAEEQAVAAAGDRAMGAVAYVTLEPCGERSTGAASCAQRLVEAGVVRVVLGAADPSRYAGGRGPDRLTAAGVTLTRGVLTAECEALLQGYRPVTC
jgi:diaminohydroxyphosphoribosylaminopyrimidine deaminase / 5-amino-6-(5-phosphoribosylamino)uracil reductase